MRLTYLILGASAIGLFLWAQSQKGDEGRPRTIDELIAEAYNSGLREPDFITAYVAKAIYPDESWPPTLNDTPNKLEFWTQIELRVRELVDPNGGFRG